MSRIRILPESLANRIAAGEVVERPASVVKEFVENSIDAGAAHVSVQIEGGGTRLIRVLDDGEGMDQDDILLSLERHATSKLTDEGQLSAIATLGFRGEALPSIASVSRMTITSRPAGAELGARVEIRHGRVLKVHEMGCAKGTVLEVRDLFGNMPARKKFLKTAPTELAHIEEVVKNYALAYPRIGFVYQVDEREVFSVSAMADDLEARVRAVGGRRAANAPLVRLDEAADGVRVHGYLVPPDEMLATAGRLRLFVNGRVIRERMVVHALAEGLRGFLMKGARPAGALFIEVPPASVDVNVHPTKQEVRFQRPTLVHQLVSLAAREGMMRYQRALQDELFVVPAPKVRRPDPSSPPVVSASVEEPPSTWAQPELAFAPLTSREPAPAAKPVASAPVPAAAPAAVPAGCPVGSDALRPIGQLLGTYILCEGEEGLVVIDQHAAHERLLFEEMKRQYAAGAVARQALLFPKVIECDREEKRLLARFAAEISALGVDIEPFGGDSYVVKAVPAIVGHLAAEVIVRDILTQLESGGSGAGSKTEAVLAGMACKAAIKGGQSLQPEEISALLRRMREAEIFSHCPHGRPVVKQFTVTDIKRWFHRG
ncbi:MAG: DNA mismatch repair endonuclease MutL [Desulfobulbaceae bacterium]|nr:DNA mismatch repair endonuclease MutL [Desulfobulbaceae bacterium]